MDLGLTDQVTQALCGDCNGLGCPRGDPPCALARDRAQLPFEVSYAGLASVTRDDLADRIVFDRQLILAQAIEFQLAGQQVSLRDLELLVRRVTDEFDLFHAVLEGTGDLVREVRSRDEHHVRQVERYAEVVIHERLVLRRIQDLHQRR